MKCEVNVAQLCPILCDPMDYTVQNTGVGVAFPFSRGSSQPRDQTQVSGIGGRFFTSWATREAQPDQQQIEIIQFSKCFQ